jgi:uncharacterized delta-60 repeat protein
MGTRGGSTKRARRRVGAVGVGVAAVAVVAAGCNPPVPDDTFGADGYVQYSEHDLGWEPARVLAQPDGRTLVLVSAEDASNSALVVRLDTDGTLDEGFADGGILDTGMTGTARCTDIELDPAGGILFSGMGDDLGFAVWRYEPDGTRDMAFGEDGTARIPDRSFGIACELARQADGRIVAAGAVWGEETVARFTADGQLDPSFGDGGVVHPAGWGLQDGIRDLIVRPDGRIVVGGHRPQLEGDFYESWLVTQLLPDGTPDTRFGEADGTAVLDLGADMADMALRPDGRLVVVGSSSELAAHGHFAFTVAQLTATGALDTRFGRAGIATAVEGGMARSMVLLDDGSLVVAGRDYPLEENFVGPDGFILAKWTPAGALDTRFGDKGVAIEENLDGPEGAYAIDVEADGKLVVAGEVPGASPDPLSRRTDLGVYRFEKP